MNTQLKKNRITILVIFAMTIIPFAFAWYFAENPQMLKLGASNGELINPPVTTEINEFSGYDAFSSANLYELKGHWVLVNIIPELKCSELCQDSLYKSRQISLMMGKDISRIRRVAVIINKSDTAILANEWVEDGHLLKTLASTALKEKFLSINSGPIPDGALMIMDPLGNLMMKYSLGFDPYKVRNDLSKLLRISQIG